MKNEDMQNFVENIREKIGEENSGLIADDLGTLITDNASMNSQLENKDKKIEKLEKDKENLISANGNLLQQIGMGEETPRNFNKNNEEKEEDKKFSFKTAFDEKGRFKK